MATTAVEMGVLVGNKEKDVEIIRHVEYVEKYRLLGMVTRSMRLYSWT